MVCIICSWCEYVGQGRDYRKRIRDVQNHEATCPDRIADELAKLDQEDIMRI